ncbi:ABC transporter ATP-binding protein/permease [Hydrogenophilus thiooxidans]|uniref:ABC transporter ATP-binding protein/permease n=1 Tax=Hydrogenophilus thiooxidans TaxID=2820326 RepID=UPI001C219CBB|nr:SbmA/BacA-like family transporter [Hydrogenophilus thiooxidans]
MSSAGVGSQWRILLALFFAFYRGPTAWRAWSVTAGLTLLTVLQVLLAVAINRFLRTLFDAFEARALEQLPQLTGHFALLLTAVVAVTGAHLWVKRVWQLAWRQFLTERFLAHWLEKGHYHRLRHLTNAADNPDARIAEDARIATEVAIELFHSLLYSMLSIALFAEILWRITLDLDYGPPGLMILLALLYAGIGSLIGWYLGLPLSRATHRLQTAEADFRFALAHVREKSEAIAIAQGERHERNLVARLFASLAQAWRAQTRGYFGIVAFSTAYGTLLPVFPLLVLASPYITGAITLGLLMQAAQAFERLTNALSWPINNQGEIARCRASIERLTQLWENLEQLDAQDQLCPLDAPCVSATTVTALTVEHLTLTTLNGQNLLADFSATAPPHALTIWALPEEGKLPLLKSLAGLWSWGSGRILYPEGATIAIVPLRPYLPEGTLLAALTYPNDPTPRAREALEAALVDLHLEPFRSRLDQREDWNRTLPPLKQRQLALVRLVLSDATWWVIECDHWPDPLVLEAIAYACRTRAQPPSVVIVTAHDTTSSPHSSATAPQPTNHADQPRSHAQSSDG